MKNVLLIVIDALRARNLGCYGYDKPTSPFIDSISEKGILFENAYASINSTDPSITTIMTGLHPITHGIRTHGPWITEDHVKAFYSRNVKLLPEILKENLGYTTYGVDWLGRWHAKGYDYYHGTLELKRKALGLKGKLIKLIGAHIPDFITHRKRLSKVRRRYRRALSSITADRLTNVATKLLRRIETPFFMLIHYWDTHMPYNAPEDVYEKFHRYHKHDDRKLDEIMKAVNKNVRDFFLSSASLMGAETVGELKAWYDAAIHYVDSRLKTLLDALKDSGEYENTMIIITSDHGESLDEHGIYFTHHGLYEVSIHVPLIVINGPEELNGKKISGFAQHVDLTPSILDHLKIKFREYLFDGESLWRIIDGGEIVGRAFIFAEEAARQRKSMIRTWEWKYIEAPSEEDAVCRFCRVIHGGVRELYNLKSDPDETRNVVDQHPNISERLRERLHNFMRALELRARKLELDRRVREVRMALRSRR